MSVHYQVRLKDTAGTPVAVFDDTGGFLSLQYSHKVNGVSEFQLVLKGDDSRIPLFVPDAHVEIWRSNKQLGLDWYKEFEGVYRDPVAAYPSDGRKVFTAHGLSFTDFLRRRSIAYPKGSAGANKMGVGESVIKSFVKENLGSLATLGNGRKAAGVMPGLSVAADSLNLFDGVLGVGAAAPLMGQTGIGDGRSAFSFAGAQYVNIYSPALAAAHNGAIGWLVIAVRITDAAVWADGLYHRFCMFQVDANNYVTIQKTSTNNQLGFWYNAGGTFEQVVDTSLAASTDWFLVGITWDKANDQVKAFLQGIQVGATQTGIGTWAGSLGATTTVLGAVNTTPSTGHKGLLARAALGAGSVLTASQMADLYASMTGDFRAALMACSPVAYWMLDDDTGTLAVSETTVGARWTGDRAYEKLFKGIQDIALATEFDFDIVGTGAGLFEFRTYAGQRGADRSTVGLDTFTALNAAGNQPVIFSIENETMQDVVKSLPRSEEKNRYFVLGQGQDAARVVTVSEDATLQDDSPWNLCEDTVNAVIQGDASALPDVGAAALAKAKPKTILTFRVLQQPKQLYGLHYTWGDIVTARLDGVDKHLKITGMSGAFDDGGERIELEYAEVV